MDARIEAAFEGVEEQRREIGRALEEVSEEALRARPDPSEWSAAQVVRHLALSEADVGRTKAAGATPLPVRLLPIAWRRGMIFGALARDIALPLPSAGLDPEEGIPAGESLAEWGRTREAMRGELARLSPDEAAYFHPVLGPLTALGMLELSRRHTAYHRRQLGRALARVPAEGLAKAEPSV